MALAVAAWFNPPAEVDKLLDDLADIAPPMPVGEGVAEPVTVLRRQARREL